MICHSSAGAASGTFSQKTRSMGVLFLVRGNATPPDDDAGRILYRGS